MPGVKGAGGPPPKRSDQRRRTNEPAKPTIKAPTSGSVEIPAADETWHPVALQWYRSLARSGQSAFYTESDWATAYTVAESMSREFSPQPIVDKDGGVTMVSLPPKGASLAAWLRAMTALLVTEGDRRRAGLELHREPAVEEANADVSELDEYRSRLRSG
jgi:hypothetical protein